MASGIHCESQTVRAMLESVSSQDRDLFLEERKRLLEGRHAESPLLDQLCLLRMVMARLSEGHARALAAFEATLEQRTRMRGGWRKSVLRKMSDEYEAPMPWLHPFKLAREELGPLLQELEAAVEEGETREREWARLHQVLEKYQLEMPLSSPAVQPRFPPGNARVPSD
jgi:hypothetical protein